MPGRKKADFPDTRPLPINHIKAWRLFRDKLTLEQLSGKTGLAVSTLSDIERRESDFSGKTLLQIANALDTDPGSLLNIDPIKGDGDLWSIWHELGLKNKRDEALGVMRAMNEHSSPNS